VAAEIYALPVQNALEVADLGPVTPVPGARPELVGIANMRGQILPVMDLAELLGIAREGQRTATPEPQQGTSPTAPPGRVLVAEAAGLRVGFTVDEVHGVAEFAGPSAEARSGVLAGTVLSDGQLIGFIDVPRLFGLFDGTQQ
jgi:chemotaxis signal transduction protein